MNSTETIRNGRSLVHTIAKRYVPNTAQMVFFYNLGLVLLGTTLLALSSYVAIPLKPVPITMQTYVLTVMGLSYGWALSGLSVALFIILGAIGIPVFSGGNFGFFFKLPTGGYIFGFFVAVLILGYLAQHKRWDKNPILSTFAVFIATIVIYIFGLTWLYIYVPSLDSLPKVLAAGLYPFIPGGIFKSVLAGLTLPFCWKFLDKGKFKTHSH